MGLESRSATPARRARRAAPAGAGAVRLLRSSLPAWPPKLSARPAAPERGLPGCRGARGRERLPEAPSCEGAVCAGSRRAARRPPPPAASRAAGRTAHSHLCVPAQRAGRAMFTEEASPARTGQGGLAGAGRRRVLPFGVQRRARLRGGERGAPDGAASASVTVRARNPGKCPPTSASSSSSLARGPAGTGRQVGILLAVPAREATVEVWAA